jgi:hypothetical protein
MRLRLFLTGLAIWLAATVVLRMAGQYLLYPKSSTAVLITFAAAFPVIAVVVRRICSGLQLPREEWLAAAFYLLLPTLFFDPFSSAFFALTFPNMLPETAGVFGGLMLWCCAAGLTGAMLHREKRS